MSTEDWRPVVGFEGRYEVSSHGRVRHVPVIGAWPNSSPGGNRLRKVGRPLNERGSLDVRGYRRVGLTNRAGCHRQRMVHILVLEAFVGPRPKGAWGLHRNGDSDDNRIENLYWGTPRENALDRVRHGRHWSAMKTHCPRGHPLTEGNLTSGAGRRCLACNRAAGHRRRLGKLFTPTVRQQIADWYFTHPGERWPGDATAGIELSPR
ncbi:NUMOD4 motif-containing HNH endonuclease [Gordonia bronchialis]|uniref:NUMOD4 motif-containing HNH endonuclease n=1 Tax=Gordonia bronchialis TaxID=2054 RepID=UPI001CBEED18|nr:NUMOD4 motif-containing HNH endonuclease [Gordonia bronchialis]